jgi:hypothetical protein
MSNASDTALNLFGFGLVAIMIILCISAGTGIGSVWERGYMLNNYCQSLNYISYTKLDGLYYCYDSDGLEAIDWMNK